MDCRVKMLVAIGSMSVWQYAVRKVPTGDLEQAPLRQVGLIATEAHHPGMTASKPTPPDRLAATSGSPRWNHRPGYALLTDDGLANSVRGPLLGESAMTLGTILIIILIIFLLGGFSGRFGGYGYGMGHSGMGLGGVILIVLIILLLLGKL